jgi:hypothetical protein
MRGARLETRSLQVRFRGCCCLRRFVTRLGSGLALDALKEDTCDLFDLVAVVGTDRKQIALLRIL